MHYPLPLLTSDIYGHIADTARRFADEVVKRISLSHLRTQLFDFALELLRVERAVHDDPQFFDVERLRAGDRDDEAESDRRPVAELDGRAQGQIHDIVELQVVEDAERRAETLSVAEFVSIARVLSG